ncbi:MAG: zinc ABC transporter substrate-binding protein [Crocinitomicaceae bacterium]
MKWNVMITIVFAITLVSCRLGNKDASERKGPLHIVATTGIIGDGLKQLVGDSAEVSAMMGPGTDPHIYRPTPADVELLDEADVIVANGLHLEGKMAEMLHKYAKEKPVLFVSDGIPEDQLLRTAETGDAFDPHIWFDPELWMLGMKHIATELGKVDTTAVDYFIANYKAYKTELESLEKELIQQIDSIPPEKRMLVTSHDAFSYFGRKFGLKVKGIQGVSTLSEVGLKDISNMVDFVIEHEIRSIFVETSTSDKTAQSIVDGCKDKNYALELAGPLYSDALGEPDEATGTYVGMIRKNVQTIVAGLK